MIIIPLVPPSYEDCVQGRGEAAKDQIGGEESLPEYTNVSNNNEASEAPSTTTMNRNITAEAVV